MKMSSQGIDLEAQPDGTFIAHGSKGNLYRVDLTAGTCECPNFKYRHAESGGRCKHLAAAAALLSEDLEDLDDSPER